MSKEITCHNCQICNYDIDIRGLSSHLKHKHVSSSKEYYDTFFKEEDGGVCQTCGSTTSFYGFKYGGYAKFCSMACTNKNEELVQTRRQSYIKYCKENPQELKERVEKTKLSYGAGSEKRKKAIAKKIKTFRENPEKERRRREKISIAKRNFWKQLTDNNSQMPYFLYIINHLAEPIIKIGITNNIDRRLSDINRDFGNSETFLLVEGKYNQISPFEDYLHDYFKEHCKVQPSGDGKTEWFDNSILDEVVGIIKDSF